MAGHDVSDLDEGTERGAALRELIGTFPSAQITEVVQLLSQDDFDRQQTKARRARGGAIGIVASPGGELVLVQRTGLYRGWALPGGTVEHGETFEAAFHREIEEEIGVEVTAVTLLVAETKRLVSPHGEQAMFLLAVFGARIRERALPPRTAGALREGLEAGLFQPEQLPEVMILGDRTKLEQYVGRVLVR